MERLFVYGTLRKAFNNEVLKTVSNNLHFEGNGYLKGKLYDLGEYPGVVDYHSGENQVKGEVYTVENPEFVFNLLDDYEGVNEPIAEYKRCKKIVLLPQGNRIKSWVYLYNLPINKNSRLISSGDYLSFIKKKS